MHTRHPLWSLINPVFAHQSLHCFLSRLSCTLPDRVLFPSPFLVLGFVYRQTGDSPVKQGSSWPGSCRAGTLKRWGKNAHRTFRVQTSSDQGRVKSHTSIDRKSNLTSIYRASSSRRAQLTPCRQTTASAWLGHSVSCMLGKVDVYSSYFILVYTRLRTLGNRAAWTRVDDWRGVSTCFEPRRVDVEVETEGRLDVES